MTAAFLIYGPPLPSFEAVANTSQVPVTVIFEDKRKGEVLHIESRALREIADFVTATDANGEARICCIPTPSNTIIYRVIGGTKHHDISFSIYDAGSIAPTVIFHKDGSVSVTFIRTQKGM